MRTRIIYFFLFKVSRRSPKHLLVPTPLQDKSKKKKGEGGRKENFKQIFSSLSFVTIIIFVCLSIHPITDCVFERECCFWGANSHR
jgi:hypothetical protein